MAQVYPFPAFRYNASKVAYDRVLTQPYDKISPAMQDKYYAADPHNLITIEKGLPFPDDTPAGVPDERNVYTRAATALQPQSRPPRTPPPHPDAHRPALPALQRPRARHRQNPRAGRIRIRPRHRTH